MVSPLSRVAPAVAGVQTLFQRDEAQVPKTPLHQANQTGRDGFTVHKTCVRDEDVENLGSDITLKTSATTDKIQAYAVSDYAGMTMLHAGRLSRTAGGWTFQPIGEAAVAGPNDVARACM